MATRSAIGYILPNGKVKAVYCHWDGQPNHQLPILEEFYNKLSKVKELIKPGSISALRTSQMWGSMPVYDNGEIKRNKDGDIVYFPTRDPQPLYHHEQDMESDPPIVSGDIESAFETWINYGCKYLYLFSRKGWKHYEL